MFNKDKNYFFNRKKKILQIQEDIHTMKNELNDLPEKEDLQIQIETLNNNLRIKTNESREIQRKIIEYQEKIREYKENYSRLEKK